MPLSLGEGTFFIGGRGGGGSGYFRNVLLKKKS